VRTELQPLLQARVVSEAHLSTALRLAALFGESTAAVILALALALRAPSAGSMRIALLEPSLVAQLETVVAQVAHGEYCLAEGDRAAAVGAVLNDSIVLACRLDQLLAFPEAVGTGLFEVDILAGLAGPDRPQGVPVVGRGDDHGVDVLVFDKVLLVLINGRLRAEALLDVGGPLGEGRLDGDYVVARQQASADNGDIVVAGIPGDEATVKTFSRRGNTIVLKPANERLSPMEFDADDVRIFGKVVTVLRRL
jgi:hypothetical protein